MSKWLVTRPEQETMGPFGKPYKAEAVVRVIEADTSRDAALEFAHRSSVADIANGLTLRVAPWDPDAGLGFHVQYENPDSQWPESGPGFGDIVIRREP